MVRWNHGSFGPEPSRLHDETMGVKAEERQSDLQLIWTMDPDELQISPSHPTNATRLINIRPLCCSVFVTDPDLVALCSSLPIWGRQTTDLLQKQGFFLPSSDTLTVHKAISISLISKKGFF